MLVSIIIPCRDKETDITGLSQDIVGQKISFDTEIIRVDSISPSGKARNTGAQKAKGEVLIFIDCDIRLGNESVLANIVNPLIKDSNIGGVSTSVRLGKGVSRFQIRYAKEIPHCESPIVDKLTDVGVASTQCLAIYKHVFSKVGELNQEILRGVDSEFSRRLQEAGYRTVLAPNTWCYHGTPENFVSLAQFSLRDGQAVAFIDVFYPSLNVDVDPRGITHFADKKSKLARGVRFISSFFKALFQGKLLLLSVKLIYAVSYLYSFVKYNFLSLIRRSLWKK